MKRERVVTGKLSLALWLSIVIVVFLVIVGIVIIDDYPHLGYGIIVIGAVYLAASVIYYEYMYRMLTAEIAEAGQEQNEIRKTVIQEMPVAVLLTDENGNVIFYNDRFRKEFGRKSAKKNVSQMFTEIYRKVLPDEGMNKQYHVSVEEKKYCVECTSSILGQETDMEIEPVDAPAARPAGLEAEEEQEAEKNMILTFCFFDETQFVGYQEEARQTSLVAGLIYVDNYEDVIENMEEVRQSLLMAVIERNIVKYMTGLNAIVKKFEKDKFLFVFEERNLEKLVESKFSILDDIRGISMGNDLAPTLSISVGVNGGSYIKTYESARMAMDLALGRGGDQAVVRDGETISYYGGKTQKVEKSTRVKARVKAHAMREIMLTHDKVFVMGHKNPDADCVGAALGIYRLARTLGKKAYIVMDKECPAIEPIVNGVFAVGRSEDDPVFVTNEEAKNLHDYHSMLVVVDVNIPGMTEYPELMRQVKTVAVLDHHRQTSDTIRNTVVSYVEPYASSACEMVAEILQYMPDKIRLLPIEADALYSGILIDTDNFVLKAGVRTFEAAAYLRRAGADVTRVRKMFREDMDHFRIRAAIVNRAELFLDVFAISTLDGRNIVGPIVSGAKAANSMLGVQGVRASFVLTQLEEGIYISARSIDDVNVQIIMEKYGGGGHLTMAAAMLKDITLNEAVLSLKEILSAMTEAGDI